MTRRWSSAVGALILVAAVASGIGQGVASARDAGHAAAAGQAAGGGSGNAAQGAAGIPVDHRETVTFCVRCHAIDESGRMTRISYVRKTPEGWQTTIRRMVMLNDVALEPDDARAIVRYLSDAHGLAPEEARPGFFDAERRMIDHDYEDEDTAVLCVQCHSMGRVITQRRTGEEWELLVSMHRGYFPLVDTQGSPGFRRSGPPRPGGDGEPADPRHPMDKALDHLSATYPLETPEWAAWSANRRTPRLQGRWAFSGHVPGRGPVFGTVSIEPAAGGGGEFTTEAELVDARSGERSRRSGSAIVYTGFQWRGRSATADGESLREVMFLERDWRRMSGRWFTGAYDEIGMEVTLQRGDVALVTGVFPAALRAGAGAQELTIHGINLPTAIAPADIDLGPEVEVAEVVEARDDAVRVRVSAAPGAAVGKRDLFLAGVARPEAIVVFDRVDAIKVLPETNMARNGGVVAPRQFAQFEAIGISYGADGRPATDDDLELGAVDASWTIEEYSATFDDDDIDFVGAIDDNGLFTPAIDGPNPERRGERNNVGDVWVVATYDGEAEGGPRRGRAHLVVTVPLYLNLEGWQVGR